MAAGASTRSLYGLVEGVTYGLALIARRFNYLALAAVCGHVRLHLVATVELLHLSNASLHSPGRNPDIEAIGQTVGLIVGFRSVAVTRRRRPTCRRTCGTCRRSGGRAGNAASARGGRTAQPAPRAGASSSVEVAVLGGGERLFDPVVARDDRWVDCAASARPRRSQPAVDVPVAPASARCQAPNAAIGLGVGRGRCPASRAGGTCW